MGIDNAFLCARMKELREKNGCTMEEMARKLAVNGIAPNKSSISRVENGKTSEKTLIEMAKQYCDAFGMTKLQTEQFLRGDKIAVPDTSALLKYPQLIDELEKEYGKVVIPKTVIDELDRIKNRRKGTLSKKAWEVLKSIGYGNRIIMKEYTDESGRLKEDERIIKTAVLAAKEYNCKVEILTEDVDYSVYLKGNEFVSPLHLREYIVTKQETVNMMSLDKIDKYYSDSYDDLVISGTDEINAYLPDGNTLIISVIRNRRPPMKQRMEKIRWLIRNGADINKRDCGRRFFPPLSHAVQMGDYMMFRFILDECHANPNVGSRNPLDSGKLRQKNEGNMPLMIAAWDGKSDMVRALCKDERISINQQDANGFTALMKACMKGNIVCRDILINSGADEKIVDLDGLTAKEWEQYKKEKRHEMRQGMKW